MTLALYGKTRRRQGALILGGFLAVLAATIFAITSINGSRDAHGLTLGSAAGTWSNFTAQPGSCPPVISGSAINWGDQLTGSGCGTQSGYLWQGATGPVVFNPGQDFPLGKFTHFNNPITGSSLLTASLGINLTFTDPAQVVPLTFGFVHQETPNQFPCEFGATNGPCNDRVGVTNPTNPAPFQVGENLYTLSITGFRGVPDNNNACPATPPAGDVNTFITAELATNRACIYARLTFVSPVIDIEKTAVNDTVLFPAPVSYNIAVTNNGGATASNVMFTDTLPPALTSWTATPPAGTTCNITAGVLTCTIATLTPGSSVSVTLTSGATSAGQCGMYPNTASISSPAHGTDSDSALVTVTCPPATRTIRVVKVTDTGTHPAADFAGIISGTSIPHILWAQSLAANGANSGVGAINAVSTAEHTVTESTPPTNWANTGYFQAPDTGQACPAAPYTGTSILVPAGEGNVLVCVRNTYTEPTRTIRVVKVTNTAIHPAADFSGTISDATAANAAWAQSLAVNTPNSGAGEINTVSTAAHTVDETSIPANWAEAGYYQVADAGVGTTACSTDPLQYTGTSAVVEAGAGNVLVCVRNTYTEPPPATRSIRVVKVTDTATHPAANFAGTITPGAPAPYNTWEQSLAENAANSAFGEINIVSTASHTVDETTTPANWTEAGYYQVEDLGVTQCSTTSGDYSGSSAVVAAGSGNVLVCVRNRFTAPMPTVSKVAGPDQDAGPAGVQAYDATYAYYQITINNSAANSIERDGIVITDSISQAQLVSVTGTGTCGGPLPIAGPWLCNDIAGSQMFTLNIRIPLDANPDGVTSCGLRQIDNVISSATISGVPLTITGGGPGNPQRVSAPPTASAECMTITKVNTGNGAWTVVFTNTGPAATVNMSDTYDPFDTDNINKITYSDGVTDVPGCDGFESNVVADCAPVIAGGDPFAPVLTTILVTTDPVSIQCGAIEVINTVSFTYNGSPAETASDDFHTSGSTCTVPSISKAVADTPYDSEFAYFQIVINNDVDDAALRNDVIVDDTIDEAQLTSIEPTSGSGACTPSTGIGPWDCDGIPAGQTLTLNVRVPLSVAGTDACLERTITNDVSVAVGPPVIFPTTSIPAVVVVPGVASADCLRVEKVNTGNGQWEIRIFNSGPATEVHLSDSYEPDVLGDEPDVITIVTGCPLPQIFNAGLDATCTASVAAGDGDDTTPEAVVTILTTELDENTCEGRSASNTAAVRFLDSTGVEIQGSPSTDTYSEAAEPGACTITLNLCKRWDVEPGEQVVGGQEDFRFTVGSNSEVFINDVDEGGPEECISLSVTLSEFSQGGLLVREDGIGPVPGDLTGFSTPLVSVNGSSPATAFSVIVTFDQCQPATTSFAGQIFALVRSISFLVQEIPTAPALCTVLFVNDDTENNLPTGNIQIEKYRDNNGDGDANDAGEGPIPGWQMTTTCPNDPTNVQDTNASGVAFIPGLNEGQSCTVTEEMQPNYEVTRVTVNGANMGASTSANVTVPGSGATAFVRFYNRELGGITVHKTTVNVLNGIETVNTNDDDGWTITVKSAACGIDLALETDANGNAAFSGLPMCTDYVVAEVLASGEPGYTPVTPASVSPVTPTVGGATQVNFTNETRSTTPPCPNCSGATPTPTPPTPSPTPPNATPTPGTPTATATPGTPTVPPATPTTGGGSGSPTPVSTIAGDRTPGPGQTPVAPSTGEGGFGGAPGGNALLILVGLGALAGGIVFMAAGHKSRR